MLAGLGDVGFWCLAVYVPVFLGHLYAVTASWNAHIVGAALILFSIVALVRPALWGEWINLVLGMWLILGFFVLPYTSTAALWNPLTVGILVVADALAAIFMRPEQMEQRPTLT